VSKWLRLDRALVMQGLVTTRSQAESYIRLGHVRVNGKVITNPGMPISDEGRITLTDSEQYVSRAGLKLSSVAEAFAVDFRGKVVLDVGSSTGGFTDYALQHGAQKVIAIDTGTHQLHSSLRGNPAILLHEKTDIRGFRPTVTPDIVLIDVSFISLREILPHIAGIAGPKTRIIAMVKPQFEAASRDLSDGVIKNDRIRRDILKLFESWVTQRFVVEAKADSGVAGAKGNAERFYLLKVLSSRMQQRVK